MKPAEPVEPAAPIPAEMTDEQHHALHQAWDDHYHAFADEHRRLAQQLRDLHAQFLALERVPAMSTEERHAQRTAILRTEGELLKRAQVILWTVQRFLSRLP